MTDARDFVIAWVDAHNKKTGVVSVAEKFEITPVVASARASYLRKRGVNLPALSRPAVDSSSVEALNKIIHQRLI
jgi:hypothetical protein